jgi:hypothetical protein
MASRGDVMVLIAWLPVLLFFGAGLRYLLQMTRPEVRGEQFRIAFIVTVVCGVMTAYATLFALAVTG